MTKTHDEALTSFREMVRDSLEEDKQFFRDEWDKRTTYGRLRLLPPMLAYTVHAPLLYAIGLGLAGFFGAFEKAAEIHYRAKQFREEHEPEVYDDA